MTFRVGQKVVCVDAANLMVTKPLTKGAVYTVRGIREGTKWDGEKAVAVLLVEIGNGMADTGEEWGYCTERFRPVVETDISFAHEIVRKVFDGVRV